MLPGGGKSDQIIACALDFFDPTLFPARMQDFQTDMHGQQPENEHGISNELVSDVQEKYLLQQTGLREANMYDDYRQNLANILLPLSCASNRRCIRFSHLLLMLHT